jgi:hypothetical protein
MMIDPNAAKRFYESIKREWAAHARGMSRKLKWEPGEIAHLHGLPNNRRQRSPTPSLRGF